MKIYKLFQEDYTIKQKGQNLKGQALVELASLGTILIFCLAMLIQYGMQANYQQNLQMQAFRRAMRAAYYKTGPASTVSLSVTRDQGIPDPRDQWGFADRQPMGATASATWGTNVNADYIENYSQTPQQRDLPRSIIEINNTADTHTLGLTAGDFSDNGMNNIGEAQGAFTTANYNQRNCSNQLMVVFESTGHTGGDEYTEVNVPCSQIRVFHQQTPGSSEGRDYAYFMHSGLRYTLLAAHVDGNSDRLGGNRADKVESVIAVRGSQACDSDGYCGSLASFKYLDYQGGRIDSEKTIIYPWETNKDHANIAAQQGLINDYSITKTNNNTMTKNESGSNLNTMTNLGAQQRTTHAIRFNTLSLQQYNTTFRPEDVTSTMGAGK